MKRLALLMSLSLFLIPLAACGGEEDGDPQAYCDKVKEFEESGEQPSAAQGRQLLDVAPSEIKDDIQVMTDALEEFESSGDSTVLESQEIADAVENSTDWENENC